MHKNPGLLKEDAMIRLLNGTKVTDLSKNAKHSMSEMFGLLDDQEVIECKRIDDYIKPDFSITYKGLTHYVSMKSGRSNVVHQELVKNFILWIRSLGISTRTQQTILLYQFGDGTMDGTGTKRYAYDELRYALSKRIVEANIELNNDKDFVLAVIERCVFQGSKRENIAADYIYHGDADYGVLVSKTQMVKHIKRRDWNFVQNLHIGPIHLRPHARYIGKEIKRETSRHKLECFWPNLDSDLDYIAERYDG